MNTTLLLAYVIIFLIAAVFVVPISRKLGFGVVLGYLVAGYLIGPHGFRFVFDSESVLHFAELGVVFMLFVIGLELKPSRLWVMRKSVFGLGSLQVGFSAILLAGMFYFKMPSLQISLLCGIFLALSSTAFAIQMLAERNELNTEFGRGSFAVLLFQDILSIPILAVLPSLAVVSSIRESNETPWYIAVLTVVGILVFGRYLSRPLFRIIANARSREMFTAFTLLIVLVVSVTMTLVGLSMALGSFLAGVVLADSEYRHELESDIDPFKGLLLGLFFMAVGMSINSDLLIENPSEIALWCFGLIALKLLGGFLAAKIFGFESEASRRLAVTLAQGSEFGFVLFAQAQFFGLIEKSLSEKMVLVISLSLIISPFLFLIYDRFINARVLKAKKEYDEIKNDHPVFIVAGFGRFGQIITRILRVRQIPFTALENDPGQVEVLRRFGSPVYYGDAGRLDLLKMAGAENAKFFVLAIDDVESSVKVAEMVRAHFPHLKILARARNRNHYFRLKDLGVAIIEREVFWSSLRLAETALKEAQVPSEEISLTIDKFTEHDFKLLEEQYERHSDEEHMIKVSKQATQQLSEVLRSDKR